MVQGAAPPRPMSMPHASAAIQGAPAPLVYPQVQPGMYPASIAPQNEPTSQTSVRSASWIWWIVGLLALGAAAGAILAMLMRH